jgi:RHS repeat-associated protein
VGATTETAFTYDNAGMLGAAGAMTVQYRADNGMVSGRTLGALVETLAHNSFGEVTKREVKYSGVSKYVVDYERDAGGRVTKKTETTSGGTPVIKRYYFDSAGRLADVFTGTNGTADAHYAYDPNGNRTSVTTDGGSPVTWTPDDQDRLLSDGAFTYEYLPNGELKKRSAVGTTDVTQYTYDVFGSLRTVTRTGQPTVDYTIDGRQLRVAKKRGGAFVQGFLHDGAGRVVGELDGAGVLVSAFVYGPTGHVPAYMRHKEGASWVDYLLVADQLGSVRMVVNASTGAVAQTLEYDAWGMVTSETGTAAFQPFGFAGGIYDRDTGLVRFGARDYDPSVGRWTTKDPHPVRRWRHKCLRVRVERSC